MGCGGRLVNAGDTPAIAIVTARGGSKRIPGKNIRLFHGKPLITWTLENLIGSRLFSGVIVSTDSEEIADVARRAGADVPFLRPAKLSDDYATTAEVADHAISFLMDHGTPAHSAFCVVYPAAVAVTTSDLQASKELFTTKRFDMVFAGCEFPSPPTRGWTLTADGVATALSPSSQPARSQDLEPAYYDAGQFYWSHHDTWARIKAHEEVSRGIHILPRWRATDIDTDEDWILAERLFSVTQYPD